MLNMQWIETVHICNTVILKWAMGNELSEMQLTPVRTYYNYNKNQLWISLHRTTKNYKRYRFYGYLSGCDAE